MGELHDGREGQRLHEALAATSGFKAVAQRVCRKGFGRRDMRRCMVCLDADREASAWHHDANTRWRESIPSVEPTRPAAAQTHVTVSWKVAGQLTSRPLGGSAKESAMPVDIRIIHPKDFICIRVDGALDLPASRELLFSLVSLVKTPGEFHILIDTRRAQASLSEVDLFELGFEVASHRAVAQSKTALLTSLGEEERARFLELVAENRGALLRAFTSFEEAITWLVMNGGEQ